MPITAIGEYFSYKLLNPNAAIFAFALKLRLLVTEYKNHRARIIKKE